MSAPPVVTTALRGTGLLENPSLNKGTAFSREERRALGLEALLPWQVESLEQQVERCRLAFLELGGDLERYAWLQTLRSTNLVLFHRFLAEHVELALPIVYTPTVGRAIQNASHSYRSPAQALFLSAPQQPRLEAVLRQACEGHEGGPPELLVVTDAQRILGLGDQGVGGIHICQGKLAVYTLCAGLAPSRGLPVILDVGTDRPELLADPTYPGLREPRLQGAAYDAFLETFVAAVEAVCPGALLHWEDFGAANALRVLDTYKQRIASFNDDIQGTSGVAAAAVLAGLRGLGRPLEQERIVIFGAGGAGCGIAERLVRLMTAAGLDAAEAISRLWLIDREGLVHHGIAQVHPAARPFRKQAAELAERGLAAASDPGRRHNLVEVIAAVRPGVLIGTSTVAGAFDHSVIDTLLAGCARPIVLPLSNPTHLAEITPDDLLRWSEGRALVATGSPFAPVALPDGQRTIGQCNNCFLFPGLGFAAMAVGASQISESMIDAGLHALAARIPAAADPEAPLMPALTEAAAVSRAVAEAVALAAVEEGLANRAGSADEALDRLDACTWQPRYPTLIPA